MKRLLAAAFLVAGAALLHAAPDEMSYQGKLSTAAGLPRTAAAVPMSVEIYDAASGGVRLYGPENHAVDVVNGVFQIRVGSVLPGLGAAVRSSPNRWLQLIVEGTPSSARQRLASAPFTLSLAAGTVGAAEVANGALLEADLSTAAVTGAKVASGQISSVHISSVSWGKITAVPGNVGAMLVLQGSTPVDAAAATFNFLSPFTVTAPSAGRADIGLDASSVTMRGNSFNQPDTLAQLDGAGFLPGARLWGNYANLTGLGAVASGTWTATTVGIAFGGTGATTAAGARANLGLVPTSTSIFADIGLVGGGDLSGGWTIALNTASVSGGCSGLTQKLTWSTTTLRLGCGFDADTDTTAMGGDVTGNQLTNTVAALQGRSIETFAPADGDLLGWDGSSWAPVSDPSGLSGSGGTVNRLVKWTAVYASSSVAGNSLMTDNGSALSVAGGLTANAGITGGNVTSGSNPGHTHTAYSPTAHTHNASQVTGFLSTNRGGTGIFYDGLPPANSYAFIGGVWGNGSYLFDNDEKSPSLIADAINAASVNHTHGNFLTLGGTDNFIGRFQDPGNIQASALFQDDTGHFGIGTISPQARLHVRGAGNVFRAENINASGTKDALYSYSGKVSLNITVPASGGGTFRGMRIQKVGTGPNVGFQHEGMFVGTSDANDTIALHGVAGATGGGTASYGVFANSDNHTQSEYGVQAEVTASAGTNNYGLYGEATGTGTNYGIYAVGSPWAGQFYNGFRVQGALSKTGGTFDIPHPDPAKAGWRLRHSFVESPTRGDNIYRWTVDVKGGRATVALPGYFSHLNEDVHVWVFPRDHAGRAYGKVSAGTAALDVFADSDGAYNVIAVGTRKDEGARQGFDQKGVEYRSEGEHP